MLPNQQIAIIIPAKNEENTIAPLVHSIYKNIPGAFICIIVNDSSDNTYRNCFKAIEETGISQNYLLKVIDKPGKAHAIRLALQLVQADYYVLMDADGQHHPAALPKMLSLLNKQKADMVIGSRFMNHQANTSFRTRFNKMMNHWVNYFYNTHLTDVLSGYRVFTTGFTKELSIKSLNFELEMELFFHALKNNFTITEYPVSVNSRPDKKGSKLNLISDGFQILKFSLINSFKLRYARN